jgi:hypothetical protein
MKDIYQYLIDLELDDEEVLIKEEVLADAIEDNRRAGLCAFNRGNPFFPEDRV